MKCTLCGEVLERIYHRFPEMKGNYCRKCSAIIYGICGFTHYANDQEEEMNCMKCGSLMAKKDANTFDNIVGIFCRDCASTVFQAYWNEYFKEGK